MTQPCPYKFPARSRAAMLAYITDRNSRSYHYDNFACVWNVKAYEWDFDGDTLRKESPDLDPKLDSDFATHIAEFEDFHGLMCQDAAEYYRRDWTSYPGTDQGEWEFEFVGRSGGWLALTKYRGQRVQQVHSDPDEAKDAAKCGYECDMENAAGWEFEKLRAFYRGLVCADSDFTSDAATANIIAQAAYYREQWEETRRAELDADATHLAAAMEAARPDLYAA